MLKIAVVNEDILSLTLYIESGAYSIALVSGRFTFFHVQPHIHGVSECGHSGHACD